ncbi:MAG: hypothetical protein AAB439_01095 [Patescibacteria group bacterium]
MAITIDYLTRIIDVPQADLTFVSGTTYNLDVDVFRLTLKSIEDSAAGIAFVDTHIHNAEVTISGVTYARFFQIVNGYRVDFENTGTHYTVNAIGANHNLNDVSIFGGHFTLVPNNSAGLVNIDVASAVWDALIANYQTAGTTGKALTDAGAAGNPWGTPVSGNTDSGTFGELVGTKLLTVAKFLGLK